MRPLLLLVAMLAACTHSDALIGADPPTSATPFSPASPIRLTYDPGMDLFPSWSADGSTLVYSYQPPERRDHDRCIALMPAEAGTRRELCYNGVDGHGRTDALEWPALDAGGNLLFTHYTSAVGDRIPDRGALRVGTLGRPFDGRVLLTLPNGVGGVGFTRIGQTEWVDDDEMLFVAQDYLMLGNIANGNKKDTTYVGLGIIRGTLGATGAAFTVVNGTDSAASFTLSATRDSIYFSRYQDARLYVVPVAGGSRQVVLTASVEGDSWLLRNPARIGTRIAYVVARFDQLPQPRGIVPGTRVEAARPGFTGTDLLFSAPPGGGLGSIVGSPGGCAIIAETRRPSGISWTTDLETHCVGVGSACPCQ